MRLPESILRITSRYFLDLKPETKRRVKLQNFNQARSIGLLYKERGESFYILVKQYVKYLKEEHGIRDIMALAYIDDKQIPFWHVHKLEFDYFSKPDLDWRLKPGGSAVNDFIHRDFDILIDFTLEDVMPLMHILAKSRARFKVGAWNEQKADMLDLMIDLPENSTFDQYQQKLNHFLTILNRKQDAQPV